MFRRDLFSLFLIGLVTVLNAAKFPSDVERCKSADSECQKKSLHDLIEKSHSKGRPDMNLIALDPLDIKSLILPKIDGSPVSVELKFKDIKLTGISKVKLMKLSGLKENGPNKFLYEIDGNFPEIVLTGPYTVEGQVLLLPITGKGNSKLVFEKIQAKIKGKCSLVEKDGKKYLNIDKVHLDLDPEKIIFSFENLLNNKEAGDKMNVFLNENSHDIYKELKPVITEAIGQILLRVANAVFSKFEYSEIFLPA